MLSETKRLILIWDNPKAANLIPKESLSDTQLGILKKIVNLQTHIKNKLKNR